MTVNDDSPLANEIGMPPMPVGHRQPRRCVVCQAPLPPVPGLATDAYPSCHAVGCRMIVDRRAGMSDAGFRHYLQVQARQRQQQAGLAAAGAARALAEAGENTAAWSILGAGLPAATTDALQLLLPCGPRRARRLAQERRERYRAHLLGMAEAAAALPAGPPAAQDASNAAAASSLPGQLCALCGGGCCTRGGEHAYLGAPTLRRYLDAHPDVSTDEVVAAYLERVPPRPQSGSCINHTRQGCSLPREMRSDTCNRYACESLARLQAAQGAEQAVQVVLVVRRRQDQWLRTNPHLDNAVNGGAVLRESGTRRMPLAALRMSAPAA